LAKYDVENEIGLTFSVYQVRPVLEDVRSFFDALTKEVSDPFVFLVTSYPGENDVLDIFEEQLNIWRGPILPNRTLSNSSAPFGPSLRLKT
jgi:hypothetical protein